MICTIDCTKTLLDSVCPIVRALHLSNDNKKLIIGTYGSEIYETSFSGSISEKTNFSAASCFMSGHYTPNKQWTNEAWGLAPFHKDPDQYVTCSDDGTLRIWSSKERKQLKFIRTTLDVNKEETPLDKQTGDLQDSVKARCVEVSPDDKLIATGFKDGFVKIYDGDSLEQKVSFKHAKEWISDLKFSPDNNFIAIGSHDNAIYLYSVPNFKKLFVMNKHSYITHLDWSENSSNLHSNCGAYELLFWDAGTGKQLPGGATALKDEHWATWTCVLGFPVQGIWPLYADGTDINYVDRSRNKHPGGYYLLASGDDFGKVRILKYPSILKNSDAVFGVGHSSHIPCVKWSENDDFLYSIGGEDNCVFQWQVKKK